MQPTCFNVNLILKRGCEDFNSTALLLKHELSIGNKNMFIVGAT